MADLEECFPRGRPAKATTSRGNNKPKRDLPDNLFRESRTFNPVKEKVKERRTEYDSEWPLEGREHGIDALDHSRPFVDFLQFKKLEEGMLILGCVRDIREIELVVSLPNFLTGTVKATAISASYTRALQEQLHNNDHDIPMLSDLFEIGQLLVCSVSNLNPIRQKIELSIDPNVVNSKFEISKLKPGLLISCSVKSIEDHGYVVDVGRKVVNAFIPKNSTDSEKYLKPHQVVRCVITKVRSEGKILMLSSDETKINKSVAKRYQAITLETIYPGTFVRFSPSDFLDEGQYGNFLSFTGSVSLLNSGVHDKKVKKPKIKDDSQQIDDDDEPKKKKRKGKSGKLVADDNSNVEEKTPVIDDGATIACVLYVTNKKQVALSTNPKMWRFNERINTLLKYKESYPIGQVYNVNVIAKVKGVGVICQVDKKGPLGMIYMRDLLESKGFSDFGEFNEQKCFKARVLQNCSLDGVLEMGSKPSILDAAYIRYEDVVLGSVVKGKIIYMDEKGLKVILGSGQGKDFKPCYNVRGFIPAMHMSDIILQHPERMFKEGSILTCRVLTVDPRRNHLHLTNKSTLVNSKGPIITSYEQLSPGDKIYTFIAAIGDYGCVVKFYNDVRGIVPNREMSSSPIESMEDEFFVGQVIKARVVDCDPEKEQMKLSFCMNPKNISDYKDATKIQLNTIVDVEVTEKNEEGLQVLVVNGDKPKMKWLPAKLPIMHLSDFKTTANAIFQSVKIGSVLKSCLVISAKPKLVSMKKSLMKFALTNENSNLTFADLENDLVLPGFIQSIANFGVFVGFTNGLNGLCLCSAMSDQYLTSPEDYYYANQSVVAVVSSVDEEKRRFTVSLRVSQVKNDVFGNRIDNFLDEINDLKYIDPSLKDISVKCGDFVNLTPVNADTSFAGKYAIKGVNKKKFTGILVDGNDEDSPASEAVVLFIDASSKLIYLSNEETVLAYSKSDHSDKITLNTMVDSRVLYINDDVTIAYITSDGDTRGRLISLLTSKHWNDSIDVSNRLYKVGNVVQAYIAKISSDGSLFGELKFKSRCSKRACQDSEMLDYFFERIPQEFGDLQIGEELQGMVHSIEATYAIIHIPSLSGSDGRPRVGRIHASEICENVDSGSFPLQTLKSGEMVSCYVIGCRDVKTHKFLDITRTTRGVLELSLFRNSCDQSNQEESQEIRYPIGSKVTAFIISQDSTYHNFNVDVIPGIYAFVPRLLVSNQPDADHSELLPGRALHCVVIDNEKSLVLSNQGSHIDRKTGNDITDMRKGCITNGEIRKILPNRLLVKTWFRSMGKISIMDIDDEFSDNPLKQFEEGQIVRCVVLESDNDNLMVLSLKKSLMRAELPDDDIISADTLNTQQIVDGYVNNANKFGIFVHLSRSLCGRVTFKNASQYYLDITKACEIFYPGKYVKCCVVSLSPLKGQVELSFLERDVGLEEVVGEEFGFPVRHSIRHEEDGSTGTAKRQKLGPKISSKTSVEEIIKQSANVDAEIKVESTIDDDDVINEPGFIWDDNQDIKVEANDDEDSGIEDNKPSVAVKLTKREKEEQLIREENEVRRKELQLLNESWTPESAAEWERLMTSNPDNSMLWVRYMAFHLHATEIEKARAVAEKAIKTINFREEQEKLNVWVSLLNLENLYGNDDSMKHTLERAMEQNDQLKVLNHLVGIYTQSGKNDKAEAIHCKLIKKYRLEKDVWFAYMRHLMVQNEHQKVQEIMKRCIKSLEKKHHLEVVCKFAQMEFELGDAERGCTMFENTISSYPKRTDIWSIYIDTLIKAKRYDDVRTIFKRVTTTQFSSKKMKSFFKRFVDFELKHGNDSSVNEAKQKAIDYIDSVTSRIMDCE